jgi:DNA-directed RNA polymerase specialized sigma24 family protein
LIVDPETGRVTVDTTQLDQVPDEALAVLAASDPEALTELYQRYLPNVYHYALCRLHDESRIEQVVANTFLHLLECIRFQEITPVKLWIFFILNNEIAPWWKTLNTKYRLDQMGETNRRVRGSDKRATDLINERDVFHLLQNLTTFQLLIIELRLFGFYAEEIAGTIDHPATVMLFDQRDAYVYLRSFVMPDDPAATVRQGSAEFDAEMLFSNYLDRIIESGDPEAFPKSFSDLAPFAARFHQAAMHSPVSAKFATGLLERLHAQLQKPLVTAPDFDPIKVYWPVAPPTTDVLAPRSGSDGDIWGKRLFISIIVILLIKLITAFASQ